MIVTAIETYFKNNKTTTTTKNTVIYFPLCYTSIPPSSHQICPHHEPRNDQVRGRGDSTSLAVCSCKILHVTIQTFLSREVGSKVEMCTRSWSWSQSCHVSQIWREKQQLLAVMPEPEGKALHQQRWSSRCCFLQQWNYKATDRLLHRETPDLW